MENSRTTYAYVQVGSFSGVNGMLRPRLDGALGLTSQVVDVQDHRRLSREALLGAPWSNVWPMVRQAGPRGLLDPRSTVGFRFSTARSYEHRSAIARRRLAELRPAFALQTQTMFDAAVPGLPLFIYTDHTMLANRRYAHPSEDVSRRREWIALEAATYRAAQRIFTTSEFTRTSLLEDYDIAPDAVVNVRSGVNIDMPERVPVRDRPVRTVLFLGLDWERKGGPVLLEAFRRLRAEHPDARLLVAGCRPRIDDDGVTVLGRIPSSDVPRLLLEADVLCLPSWVEPSAVVYLEAAAYGLPVVATAVGGTPERVLHQQTGLLGPPGDAEVLHRLLTTLVQDDALAQAYGRAGHALVRADFTWPVVADRLARGIREVLELPDAPLGR